MRREYLDGRVFVADVEELVEVVEGEVQLDDAVLVSGERRVLELGVQRDVFGRVELFLSEVVYLVQVDVAVVRSAGALEPAVRQPAELQTRDRACVRFCDGVVRLAEVGVAEVEVDHA